MPGGEKTFIMDGEQMNWNWEQGSQKPLVTVSKRDNTGPETAAYAD